MTAKVMSLVKVTNAELYN